MLGLLILFSAAFLIVIAVLTAIVVRDARRPPRHTAGYAVAHGLACDPGDMGLAFEEWSVDLPDGGSLPVWDIPPDDTQSNELNEYPGPTVIFVHGHGGSRIDMLARMNPWRAIGARIILYDRRGHGDSTVAAGRLGAGEGCDLLALLRGADESGVTLVGFGLAASIVLQAAADREEWHRVAAVVLYNPDDDVHASLQRRLHGQGHPARPITDLAMAWLRLCGIRPSRLQALRSGLPSPVLVYSGDVDSLFDLPARRPEEEGVNEAAIAALDPCVRFDVDATAVEEQHNVLRGFVAGGRGLRRAGPPRPSRARRSGASRARRTPS